MSIFIRRIETIYDGMELEEKQALLDCLSEKAKEDGLRHATTISMTGSGPAKVSKAEGRMEGAQAVLVQDVDRI